MIFTIPASCKTLPTMTTLLPTLPTIFTSPFKTAIMSNLQIKVTLTAGLSTPFMTVTGNKEIYLRDVDGAAISSASGNLLSLKNDGLFAGDAPVTSVADFSAVLQQSFGFSSGS